MTLLTREVETWIPKEATVVSVDTDAKKENASGPKAALLSGFDAEAAKTYTRLFRQVASIPLVKTGSILPSKSDACVVLEHEDLENNERVQWNHRIDLASAAPPNNASNNLPVQPIGKRVSFTSPSKKRTMTVVSLAAPGGGAESAVDVKIEFSDSHGLTHSFTNVKKVHKGVAADALFQNVHWSQNETEVYYVAECIPQTSSKFWDEGAPKSTDGTDKMPFGVKDTWGERVPDLSTLSLFKINLVDMSVKRVLSPKFAQEFSVAMPVVLEQQKCIIFGAFPHSPLRLGVAAYNARRNRMFKVPLSEAAEVEPEDISSLFVEQAGASSVCAMRANPFNPNLVAVVHALNTDIHGSGCDLSILHVDTMKLVPCVQTPKTGSPQDPAKDFPGLYPFGGSTDLNWVNDQFLLLGSIRRSAYVIYSVDATAQGKFSLLSSTYGAWRVLDVFGGKVLATRSSVTQPPQVLVLDLEAPKKDGDGPEWRVVFDAAHSEARPQLHAIVSKLSTEVVPIPEEGNAEALVHTHAAGDKVSEFLSHLSGEGGSGQTKKTPTIGFVHGGPHATDVNSFSYGQFFALCCGYDIVSVNYEGSLGFGQQHAEALPGHCGTKDVRCTMAVLNKLGRTNKEKYDLFIAGGSHGGFLSCHLTGQYPDTFKATAMRNPVTNLNAMLDITDIPDWVVVECGILKTSQGAGTAEDQKARLAGNWDRDVQRLHDCSPIRYVNQVRCPTLVGIGLNDMRVPITQGKAWYRALKRNQDGKDVKQVGPVDCSRDVRLLEYPGTGHAMDSVHADADFHIHQMLFFDAQL